MIKFTHLRPLLFQELLSSLEILLLPVVLTRRVQGALIELENDFKSLHFCIYYQDVRSLRIKCRNFVDNVPANNFKIYCITETWLNNIYFLIYAVFRADRHYLT
jgi:hypothetical protein